MSNKGSTTTPKKGDKRGADELSSAVDLSTPISNQSFTGYLGSPPPLRFDVSCSSKDPISYRAPTLPPIKKTKWGHSRTTTSLNPNLPNPNTTQPQLVIQKFISKAIQDNNTFVSKTRGFHTRSQTHKDGSLRGLNSTFNHVDMYGNNIAGIF